MSVKFIKPIEEIDEEFIKTHFRQDFIIDNYNGDILEIGGGHNSISKALSKINKNLDINLTSFDPNGKILKNINLRQKNIWLKRTY